jgi:hypothetical protein
MKKQRSHKLLAAGLSVSAWAMFAAVASASQISVVLDPNYPSDYTFYNFTATDGSTQTGVPAAPYQISITGDDGEYNNAAALAICLDYNNPSNVGESYSGQLVVNTDLASMETSYLANMLNLEGGESATTAERGAVSFAIWQIDFPTSTQTDGAYFPADPAAAALELQAYSAVTSGTWTTADNALYPTFEPVDTTSQRYAVILPGNTPVQMEIVGTSNSSTPEPGTVVLLGTGLVLVAAGLRHRARA